LSKEFGGGGSTPAVTRAWDEVSSMIFYSFSFHCASIPSSAQQSEAKKPHFLNFFRLFSEGIRKFDGRRCAARWAGAQRDRNSVETSYAVGPDQMLEEAVKAKVGLEDDGCCSD
jgi:hypothetical protein